MAKRNRRRPSRQERQVKRRAWFQQLVLAPLRLILLAALGIGLGMGSYWVVAHLRSSPALAVRRIEVSGLQRSSLGELLELAELREGMNVFAIDVERAGRLMEEHPWVAEAEVQRVVPDRLLVDIREHHPRALVSLGGLYLANEDGAIFKRLQPGEEHDLPVVTGVERDSYRLHRQRVHGQIRAAMDLARRVERADCLEGRKVSEVHLDELLGPSLMLDPGAVRVRLGGRGAEARLPMLCRVFEEMKTRKVALRKVLLDLSSRPSWAVVVPEERGPAAGMNL